MKTSTKHLLVSISIQSQRQTSHVTSLSVIQYTRFKDCTLLRSICVPWWKSWGFSAIRVCILFSFSEIARMKWASVDNARSMIDEAETRAKVRRHQNLVQEYTELEKEFVTKKKRYSLLKLKRATLMAEVQFLRRRYRQLLQIQASNKFEDTHRLYPSNIAQVPGSSQVNTTDTMIGKTCRSTDLHPIPTSVGLQDGRSLEAPPASSLRPNKMLKKCSINEKGMMKKKNISWEDLEPLKV